MKVEILKPCVDKKTHEELNVGDVVTMTKTRFNESNKNHPGYLKEVKEDE